MSVRFEWNQNPCLGQPGRGTLAKGRADAPSRRGSLLHRPRAVLGSLPIDRVSLRSVPSTGATTARISIPGG
jgi:hypothetical protein